MKDEEKWHERLNENDRDTQLRNDLTKLIVIVVISAAGLLYTFSPKKDDINAKQTERDTTIREVKKSSSEAAKKGDSLLNILKTKPYLLDKEDLNDSVVKEYLKNYKYEG